MFNLNIPPSSLLGVEGSGGLCSKPNTPEILNSLIAMTNPLDHYNYSNQNNNNSASTTPASVTVRNFNAQNISQDSCHSSSSSTPLDSPAGLHTTPSVQQTCSQLIKAGLKLSIQSKRKLSTCDSSSGSEQPMSKCSRPSEDFDDTTDDECDLKTPMAKGLTAEDEDRRKRRRERNKIAATKCRMKKRERTQNLIKEAEQLDSQNVDLKSQVRILENERRKLLDMLQAHEPACVHHEGLSLPSKLLQSPAYKYLADLNMDDNSCTSSANSLNSTAGTCNNNNNNNTSNHNGLTITSTTSSQSTPQQRTAIPPMSTIKFSRSNGFKAASAALTNNVSIVSQLPSLTQNSPLHHHTSQLPNGYCKASPTPQELGYLNSPSQDSATLCIAALHTQTQLTSSSTTPTAQQTIISSSASSLMGHSMSDYIPNCDSQSIGLTLAHTPTTCSTPIGSNGCDNSALLASVASPMSCVSTPTTANEFVKNELVDSQSPYTTAQSAERFLFENNCDSFIDIKHAVNVHQSLNNNHGGPTLLQNTHSGSNMLDFTSSLMGGSGSGIVSFHDQISIKNDYLHEVDLLAQLTGEGAEFVDLDTGVAAAFMTNGGCLA